MTDISSKKQIPMVVLKNYVKACLKKFYKTFSYLFLPIRLQYFSEFLKEAFSNLQITNFYLHQFSFTFFTSFVLLK